MSQVDLSSVLEKLYAWERSEKGQKKIQDTINSYVSKGKDRTDAGSLILTKKKIASLADELVKSVRNSAVSCGLPASVSAHFSSLKRGAVVRREDGSYSVEINFTDDLTRESLQPENYGGVTNIIAIFNNGYPRDKSRAEAISHISGWWHGKSTFALPERPGLYFMQRAVNDFNSTYGVTYDIYAELDAVYDSE